jgi:GxxExxY protein
MNTGRGSGHPYAEDAEDSQKSQKEQPIENDCSHAIIGAAVEVQRVLGVGLLESAYCAALAIELRERELDFQREVTVPGMYKGQDIGVGYRTDFIVERAVIVEVKAVPALVDIHRAQLLSYLRLSGLKLGLLINFHSFPVVKGTQRVVNKL